MACDGVIRDWADTLTQAQVEADLCWFSGILQRDVEKPMAECILHFFNHQTHHRGQVHAMLTAAGHEAPVTDLIFMPETF
ncbi:DinB family protein [Sulfitobacter delicatus]|uniref:DinB family protein n=1 Tax=Sulfitobacter delicatus TaxID=218672 RepID=A0A1G7QVR8_9RHOB|nr:DinB family protein [Sulfitobacter delicatus]